jgi:hypothetical protein
MGRFDAFAKPSANEASVSKPVLFSEPDARPLAVLSMKITPASSSVARIATRLLAIRVRLPLSKSTTVSRETTARRANTL